MPHPIMTPNQLPDRWWERPTQEVEALIEPVRWGNDRPHGLDGEDLERLLRHHPSLVSAGLNQGLSAHLSWRSTPEDPLCTALWHALELSAPEGVLAIRRRGGAIDTTETSRVGTLPIAVVHLGRHLPEDSPLRAWSDEARMARETDLLRHLAGPNDHPLLGRDPEDVVRLTARLRLPEATLQGLMAHGMDLNTPQTKTQRPSPLQEMVAHGDASDVTRWLNLGWEPWRGLRIKPSKARPPTTSAAASPDDALLSNERDATPAAPSRADQADQAALNVLRWALPRPDESAAGQVTRINGILHALHQHGWTPGPRFQALALGVAASHAQNAQLLLDLRGWGVDPNGVDAQGCNALHHATRLPQGLLNVPILLDMGVNPHTRNAIGDTPIDTARSNAAAFSPAAERYATVVHTMENQVLHETLSTMNDAHESPPSLTNRDRPRL